jgi:nucleoside-diphosphate-sugar epimerase
VVVGNGLLGKSMNLFADHDDILIFASGVSNSKENRVSEYDRELNLLHTFLGTEQKIIYFSTCSVLYDCIKQTDYIKHKIQVEDFIKSNFKNYIIFRLPNVVGHTENQHTSFNFFKRNLLDNVEINVEENTTRYFIDVDDIVETIIPIIKDQTQNKKKINVCFDTKISIIDLIGLMSDQLKVTPKINIIKDGCSFDVDNVDFLGLVGKKYKSIDQDYNYNLIKKYC